MKKTNKTYNELLKETCAHCGDNMYAIVRAHHHTETVNGKEVDVTKRRNTKKEEKQCDKCGRYLSDIDYANYNGKCPFDCS